YRSRANRVIYVFNLTSPLGVLSWAAGRLGGAQLVVSLNDINEPGETVPDSLRFRLDFWLQKRLIPHFDGHVVVADAIAEDFLPGRPYVRVEGGVDELTEEDQAPSVAPETFSMVLAGTLNEANGVGLLLDALKILNDAALRVRIAGQGPMLDAVRQAARDDSRIEYVGFLGLGEVRELYRRSDLLLNLRLTRAVRTRYFFPSKVIEFLASGTPLLTTCPGHVRSEFSDLAFLLEEETPEALASLLRKVMTTTSEERLRQAKLAREQIFASHSWLAHGRRVASYIRGVVAQGRR
ncbi:MAG: glycosyltransferase family 4 protein, partial [Myxococcales bacterium]|nr:glycosyltransferase family 4 protein [Myxococcales bacterium]